MIKIYYSRQQPTRGVVPVTHTGIIRSGHLVHVSGFVSQWGLDIRHRKTFSPFTITFMMAIGTEPFLSTGYKEKLGAGEAGALS